MSEPNEPHWKQLLNWGSVILFFGLPIGFFVVHYFGIEEWKPGEFHYLTEFERNLALLVFGLSGLRTAQVFLKKKNGNGDDKKD
jgi:hypothetical protein